MRELNPKERVEEAFKRLKNNHGVSFKPEILEIRKGVNQLTGWPEPKRRYRIDFESEGHHVENMYYWLVQHAHNDFDMPILQKVTDSHAASGASEFFGNMQQKIGAQQGNVSNYMATIGKLVKDLFPLIRELRQIEERLGYYTNSYEAKDFKARKNAEATLKDIWITMVEGGTQNPTSVFGMAQRAGFTILPDLFFQAPPMEDEGAIDTYINTEMKDFNKAVKEALRRKLMGFLQWKKNTYVELSNKKKFQIGYLKQHYETVKMYMSWLKPYLKNLEHLGMDQAHMDDPLLVRAFETSLVELEVLIAKPPEKNKDEETDCYSVVLMHFFFRSKPSIHTWPKENRGVVHVGRTEATIRAYGWTKKEIEAYKKYREDETMEYMKFFNRSVKQAMDDLAGDFAEYLNQVEPDSVKDYLYGKEPEKPKEEKKEENAQTVKALADGLMLPFVGFSELLSPLLPLGGVKDYLLGNKDLKEKKSKDDTKKANAKKAAGGAAFVAFQCFKNYKKAHRMFSW